MDPLETFRSLTERDEADIHVPAAALALADVHYQGVDFEANLETLRRLGETARAEVGESVGGARLDRLANCFHQTLGFDGDRDDYYDIRNNFLNDALTRRRGLPIVLSVVFIAIAEAAGVTVDGVAFPTHFVVRDADKGRVIDVFNGCRTLTPSDLRATLARAGIDPREYSPMMLAPCGKRALLARMIRNLSGAYRRAGDTERSRTVDSLLGCLTAREPRGTGRPMH